MRPGVAVPVVGVADDGDAAGDVEERVERNDVRRRGNGEGVDVEEELALDEVADQAVGVGGGADAVEDGVAVGGLDERRVNVNDSEASAARLMNDWVWRSCDRPPIGSAGISALPPGPRPDPVGDAVGGGDDLPGGDAVRRLRRPVRGANTYESWDVARSRAARPRGRRPGCPVDLDLRQRVAAQLLNAHSRISWPATIGGMVSVGPGSAFDRALGAAARRAARRGRWNTWVDTASSGNVDERHREHRRP